MCDTYSDPPIGFLRIPEFPLYGISPTGDVIHIATRYMNKRWKNPAGYVNYTLRNVDGRSVLCGRHRLLCLVYKRPNVENINDLIVNHINGIKGDDRLDNLEWVTPQENCEHAGRIGISPKCISVSVRDVDTGEIRIFPSIRKCAAFFSMTKDEIVYRLSFPEDKVYPERRQYKIGEASSDAEWIIPLDIDRSIMSYGTEKAILVRVLEFDIVRQFSKLSDAAAFLNIAPSTLTGWLKRKDQPVFFPQNVQVKLALDRSPWRNVSNSILENANRVNKLVKVTNDITGNIQIYNSCKECADSLGILTTTLNNRLKSTGKTVFADGNRYEYYTS